MHNWIQLSNFTSRIPYSMIYSVSAEVLVTKNIDLTKQTKLETCMILIENVYTH